MACLLDRIARESGYEKLLVDVGQMGKGALPILENCDAVYMPVKDDCISAAKVEEFDEYVKAAGSELLQGRIHTLKLPYHNSFGRRDTYMEQLLWGGAGILCAAAAEGRAAGGARIAGRCRGRSYAAESRAGGAGRRGTELAESGGAGRRIRYADGEWGK